MQRQEKEIQLGFTSESYPDMNHICLIYDNEEQRQKIVSAYIASGLRKGEQVRYFTDNTTPETIRSWLLDLGIDLSEAEKNGTFGISKAEKAYCPDGHFEPQKIIEALIKRYDITKEAGYAGSCACGEMTWALKNIPGSERLLEYEILLNTVDVNFPHTGMCQYDARLFDGATLFKVLQVHPYMIVQGQIARNPFFIRPEAFQVWNDKK